MGALGATGKKHALRLFSQVVLRLGLVASRLRHVELINLVSLLDSNPGPQAQGFV